MASPSKSGQATVKRLETQPASKTAITHLAGGVRVVEVDEALRRPGTVANRSLEQSIYLHQACLPLALGDLGERDVREGSPRGAARGCAGCERS